jgi:hypothetical protein
MAESGLSVTVKSTTAINPGYILAFSGLATR